VDGNEVTLTGKVPSRDHKRLAEQCAESIVGVEDVHNRLKIDREMDKRDAQLSRNDRGSPQRSTKKTEDDVGTARQAGSE
jgi:hypothetical protein